MRHADPVFIQKSLWRKISLSLLHPQRDLLNMWAWKTITYHLSMSTLYRRSLTSVHFLSRQAGVIHRLQRTGWPACLNIEISRTFTTTTALLWRKILIRCKVLTTDIFFIEDCNQIYKHLSLVEIENADVSWFQQCVYIMWDLLWLLTRRGVSLRPKKADCGLDLSCLTEASIYSMGGCSAHRRRGGPPPLVLRDEKQIKVHKKQE